MVLSSLNFLGGEPFIGSRGLLVADNLAGPSPIRIPVLARHLLLLQAEDLATLDEQFQPGGLLGNQMAWQISGPDLLVRIPTIAALTQGILRIKR